LLALRLCLPVVLFYGAAAALDPGQHVSQYSHTAWRIQDGVFSGAPHVITQTKDGYLWIGTEGGLVRFDGVRFVPWTAPEGKGLRPARIFSLLGGSDGSLWIGTGRGLARWKDGELTKYRSAAGFIEAILQDPEGNIWMTRSQVPDPKGGLCQIAASSSVRCYGQAEGLPFVYAQPMARDGAGDLWIGSSAAIARWSPGPAKADVFVSSALKGAAGLQGVSAIAAKPDGSLWVGFSWPGKGLGLQQFASGIWKNFAAEGFDSSSLKVSALLIDQDGGLWVGTDNQGLYRIYGDKVDRFGSSDGLSSDSILGFYQDREGDLWVVTSKGIDRFHNLPVTSFSMREGLTSEDAHSVLATPDGTVWIGSANALESWRKGKLSAIREGSGLPGHLATSLFEDGTGRLWVGIDGGLAVYENGRFRPVNKPDGAPVGVVVAITEDVDHDIWVDLAPGGLLRIRNYRVVEEIPISRVPRALTLAADPTGGIWLAPLHGNLARYRHGQFESFSVPASENPGSADNLLVDFSGFVLGATTHGLLVWKDGKLRVLTSRNGLPCDNIDALAEDDRNFLWLEAQCGLAAIARSELEEWWQEPNYIVKSQTLDVFDGAQTGLSDFRPAAAKSSDGKIWFATGSILESVDPAHLAPNPLPPPVQLEQVIADRRSYTPESGLRLPPRTRDIEIDYTALSFVVPQKVRFRYQLEGHDAEWQDPQGRRQAFYSDLSPGTYRFHVIASNNDGVWNETGATMAFTVLPAYYQTAWFRLLCCAGFALLLWLLYRLRLRQVAARMHARLEERLEERERIARDLHDTLLQGFLSAYMQLDVANDRLPPDSPAKPLVQRVLDLMQQVSEEGRNAIRSLRPSESSPDDLEQVLSRIPEEFTDKQPIDFRVIVEGEPRALHGVIREEVCRVAREAIINAFRHSKATKIEVEIKYARGLAVVVRDNGCGIDAQVLQTGREGHWGLSNMRERAEKIGAKLGVMSRPGAGTEVELSAPSNVAFEATSPESWWKWLIGWFPRKTEADVPAGRE
jgi:signal transduction histidine kinase/ligand-binding sensor domain-containing protein